MTVIDGGNAKNIVWNNLYPCSRAPYLRHNLLLVIKLNDYDLTEKGDKNGKRRLSRTDR
jgi:hypothetical protein